MKLVERLKQVTQEIERNHLKYALAGGLVASLYRKAPRATADIDLVVLTDSQAKAESLLRTFGLKPYVLRQASLEGGPQFAVKRKSTPVFMLCGRDPDQQATTVGVDLILSNVPWVPHALERALANQVDFGFGSIPCITPEDFILSKLYSVGNQSTRFMDLDDLRSVFESDLEVDWTYVRDQMMVLKLTIPESLFPFVPKNILKWIKGKRR